LAEKILIVEDEFHIARGLQINLENDGYQVTIVDNGQSALDFFRENSCDMIILDVMLPEIDGFEVCSRLRSSDIFVPVLFLTAKSDGEDVINGLKSGGDDYLTKPFDILEVKARILAILRRKKWYESSNVKSDKVEFGRNSVDFGAFRASNGSEDITLTQKECMVLKLLTENEGQVVTRDTILDIVWGVEQFPTTRTIDNLILRLRKYFEDDPKKPVHILTHYGTGYEFRS
jgi:two-component system, OmpR family, alkaline phosphatase synthesis response regulator PhoP